MENKEFYTIKYENRIMGEDSAYCNNLIDTVVMCWELINLCGYIPGSLEVYRDGEDVTDYIIFVLQKITRRLNIKAANILV